MKKLKMRLPFTIAFALVLISILAFTCCVSAGKTSNKVSDEERFNSTVRNIYGREMSVQECQFDYDISITETAKINSAYLDSEGNYLINSTGLQGYNNGQVTCWVIVNINNGGVCGIGKVVVDSNVHQSYIKLITDQGDLLEKYTSQYADGITYNVEDGYLVMGATHTSNAVNNSVNGAITFVKALMGVIG